jgi:hypothetical protein
VLIVVLLTFFWPLRAYLLVGNATYPANAEGAVERHRAIDASRPQKPFWFLAYPWIFHFQGKMVMRSATENPCGMFLVLCWPVWLLMRRRWTAVGWILLFFCGLYFLYWGFIWGVLRYGILPFLLVFLFTAARLFALHEGSRGVLRASVQAALCYSFLFAILVVVPMYELSAAQLRIFTGQSDAKEYLRTVEIEYPPLEYLAEHSEPDDVILSATNCAHGYAPRAGQFHCTSMGDPRRAITRIPGALRERDYDFLVVPRHLEHRFRPRLRKTHRFGRVYRDAYFSVLRLDRLVREERQDEGA